MFGFQHTHDQIENCKSNQKLKQQALMFYHIELEQISELSGYSFEIHYPDTDCLG